MKNLQIKITNQDTYDRANVWDVNFHNCSLHYDRKGDLAHIEGNVSIELTSETKEFQGEHGVKDFQREYGFIIEEIKKYDIVFNDGRNVNSKGFEMDADEAIDYVKAHNGSDHSYFADYKGGEVSVVNIADGEPIYSAIVK